MLWFTQDTLCPPAPSVAGERGTVCLHLPALAPRGTQAETWGKPPCALPACCAVRAHSGAKSAGFVVLCGWLFGTLQVRTVCAAHV